MNLIDIKNFLQKLEKMLNDLQFDIKESNEFYSCELNHNKCIVIPYISKIGFSFENIQKIKVNNLVIVGEHFEDLRDIKLKHISIDELRSLIKIKETDNEIFNMMLNQIFFNNNLTPLLEKYLNKSKIKK